MTSGSGKLQVTSRMSISKSGPNSPYLPQHCSILKPCCLINPQSACTQPVPSAYECEARMQGTLTSLWPVTMSLHPAPMSGTANAGCALREYGPWNRSLLLRKRGHKRVQSEIHIPQCTTDLLLKPLPVRVRTQTGRVIGAVGIGEDGLDAHRNAHSERKSAKFLKFCNVSNNVPEFAFCAIAVSSNSESTTACV